MKITTFSEVTIDGRLTLGRGETSKRLFDFYGPVLREWFHAERAAHDAIMVGAGTVRSDNPELTVRHAVGANPLRVIPTNDGHIPADSHVLTDGHPTLFAVPENLTGAARDRLLAARGVTLMTCGNTTVDLTLLARGLAARGIARLMVEGGSRLLHGILAAGLADRIVIKHIPVISGSIDAPTWLARGAEGEHVPLSRWQAVDWRMIGGVGVSIYEPLKGTFP
jgi:5-amino-6-(5-phosphoribosylamino)uracil reductase/2,5-diamino-6-(ribosylamino)-4(3H)-pyrimidinone 5'-phosphate reductase